VVHAVLLRARRAAGAESVLPLLHVLRAARQAVLGWRLLLLQLVGVATAAL
jgi:hypothetical protein